jgi:hypothetical protein
MNCLDGSGAELHFRPNIFVKFKQLCGVYSTYEDNFQFKKILMKIITSCIVSKEAHSDSRCGNNK